METFSFHTEYTNNCCLFLRFGGLVLDRAIDKFKDYSIYQPIINGIGGNLVSVHSSRMSTMLHKTSLKGVIPPHTKQLVAPWTALFMGSKGNYIKYFLFYSF